MTLTEFLLARIAEDEALARKCIEDVGAHRTGDTYSDGSGVAEWDAFPHYPWGSGEPELRFMAGPGHPDRVLAECEAKRRIVDDHAPTGAAFARWDGPGVVRDAEGQLVPVELEPACRQCTESSQEWRVTAYWDSGNRVVTPCDTLRHLAAIYAEHPDYRQEWTP